MTIKAHYDGKVFVPDEPIDVPVGQAADVHVELQLVTFTGGAGATMGDLIAANGLEALRVALGFGADGNALADNLRARSNSPSEHKQRAFAQLNGDRPEPETR